jgi:nicotinamide-nucleotide amidase
MSSFLKRYSHSSTSFVRIPLEAAGALWVSPMPYGRYDRDRVFRAYKAEKLTRVVVLLSDDEIAKRCSRDLKKLYARHSMQVTQFPMIDFLQPGHGNMDRLVPELVKALRAGEKIAIHCHAGVGRSSVVVSCLVAVLHNLSVEDAIAFVRTHMESNITVEQKHFISGWIERLHESRPGDPILLRGAEVIATGSELLQGRTLNQHGHTLGRLLTGFGIPLLRETVLPDHSAAIRSVVSEALARSDLVIVTGGLGPTDDDLTLEAVADAVGRRTLHEASADAHLEAWFQRVGRVPSEAQRRQARVIDGASVYLNPAGIAPGQRLTLSNSRHLWLLPGPPRELHALVASALQPWLESATARADRVMAVFRILGHSESAVEKTVISFAPAPGVDCAYCARPGSVELRFTGPLEQVEKLRTDVRRHFAADLLNESGDSLEQEVGKRLLARGERVATAESFTAGGIAERLTDVPGSSAYVVGGIVAYDNAIKVRELGVDPAVLAEHGAVSEAVAGQMADGVRKKMGVEWGLSVTGIAGPGGGSETKPVGLFFVGIASAAGLEVFRFQVNGDRAQIREHGVQRALECLWRKTLS